MKITKSTLGILAFTLVCSGTATLLKAEEFIGPTSPTNRLIIGTNEAVLIDTVLPDVSANSFNDAGLTVSNITYHISLQAAITPPLGVVQPTSVKLVPFAIPGPAELILSNAYAVHLTRLTNASMRMVEWGANSNLVTISVPVGKTIQFLWSFTGNPSVVATLTSGTQSFDVNINPGDLIQGPITVSFDYNKQVTGGLPVALVSYWFIEDVFQNPQAVLSLGAGVPNVLVQKSADLKNWQPVATFPMTLGSNGFYRLQIPR
jgi:hypothetical protein